MSWLFVHFTVEAIFELKAKTGTHSSKIPSSLQLRSSPIRLGVCPGTMDIFTQEIQNTNSNIISFIHNYLYLRQGISAYYRNFMPSKMRIAYSRSIICKIKQSRKT